MPSRTNFTPLEIATTLLAKKEEKLEHFIEIGEEVKLSSEKKARSLLDNKECPTHIYEEHIHAIATMLIENVESYYFVRGRKKVIAIKECEFVNHMLKTIG